MLISLSHTTYVLSGFHLRKMYCITQKKPKISIKLQQNIKSVLVKNYALININSKV